MDLCENLEIYTFNDKTLAERLDEYINILSTRDKIIPAKDIQAEWSSDVEIVIESSGWQALWKISRCICEEQNISYPTMVLVEVLKMKYSTLHAEVKIVAVVDNINLPEKYEVPLIELYPTINQKDNSLDIEGTAHCVDRLRFFYNHLWMPWDEDEDENVDWVERHLEPRIRLFFYMNSNIIDKEICNIIKSLINEAKEIKQEINNLPIILKKLCEETWNDKEKSKDYLELGSKRDQFRFRLQQIKAEMNLLEIFPIKEQLRKSLTCYNKMTMKNYNKREKTHYLVWRSGTVKELQKLSNKIQEMFSEDTVITVCKYLEEALDIFKENDTILLGEGHYLIDDFSELEKGGSIIGICNADSIILYSSNFSISSMFDFFGTEVLLKNIYIELDLQTGIVVRKNCTVNVIGCRLYVPNTTSNNCTFGAVVMPDGNLVLDNTVFEGLETAVVLYSTGKVAMNECRFEKCNNGVWLQDNAHLAVTKCSFENIENPFVMETEKVKKLKQVPGYDMLMSIKEIFLTVNDCKFSTNDKIIKLKDRKALHIID